MYAHMYLGSNVRSLAIYAEWTEGVDVRFQASRPGGNIAEPQCGGRRMRGKDR